MDEPAHFALFGNPVSQSLSPAMHTAAFARMGISADYAAYRVDNAAEVVRRIRKSHIQGASITIPFKETLLPLLDDWDPAAAAIGAVNTIVNRDGRLAGHNTDVSGLIRDLSEWIAIRGTTFVVLGAGGAARAAVYSLREAGDPHRRQPDGGEGPGARRELRLPLGARRGDRRPAGGLPDQHDTSGDVPGDEADASGERNPRPFPAGNGYDLQPHGTRLLREAEAAGRAVRSGVGMFVHQGAEQIRLWTGQEPPREEMRRVVVERLGNHD